MNRAELKAKAKASLKGKYGDAILMMIIYYLINFAVGLFLAYVNSNFDNLGVNLLANIVSMIISVIFTFGMLSYYLKVSRNEEVTYKELFSKLDFAIPYILISLVTGLFIFLWSLLFIIPGIIASINYSLVYLIKLDNPEMDTMAVLDKSKQMMKGYKMEYFVLLLSFLGWSLLGIFTLGILYLWLIPYMNVTLANFYNNLKQSEATI